MLFLFASPVKSRFLNYKQVVNLTLPYTLQRDENGNILCYRFEVKPGEYWYSVKIDGYIDDTATLTIEKDGSSGLRLGKTGMIEY